MGLTKRRPLRLYICALPLLLAVWTCGFLPPADPGVPQVRQVFLEDGTVRYDLLDGQARLTQQLFYSPDGQILGDAYTFAYDSGGRLARRQTYDTHCREFYSSDRYLYDQEGRLTRIESRGVLEPRLYAVRSFAYDGAGRVVKETVHGHDASDGPLSWQTFAYSGAGDLQSRTDFGPDGQVQAVLTYGPSQTPKQLTVYEPGQIHVTAYDEQGRPSQQMRYTSAGKLTGETRYRYHPSGCLAEQTQWGPDGAPIRTDRYDDRFDMDWAYAQSPALRKVARTVTDRLGRVTEIYCGGEAGPYRSELRLYEVFDAAQVTAQFGAGGEVEAVTRILADGAKETLTCGAAGTPCKLTRYGVDGRVTVTDYRLPRADTAVPAPWPEMLAQLGAGGA